MWLQVNYELVVATCAWILEQSTIPRAQQSATSSEPNAILVFMPGALWLRV